MSEGMSTEAKNAIAAVTASVTTAVQCVLGFTRLGAKLGVERTLVIVVAGVTVVAVIVVWVATSELPPKQRRVTGLSALATAFVLTLTVLWATFTFHSILVTTRHIGQETVTSFRGAITSSDPHVEFYTKPASVITFTGYAGTKVRGKSGIQRFSDTKFSLRQLSTEKTIVLHHVSEQVVQYEPSKTGNVGFTTQREIWWKIAIAAAVGGIVCVGAALLVWWLSSSSRVTEEPKPPIGFHTEGELKTPPPGNPSVTSPPAPTTKRIPPTAAPVPEGRSSSTTT